MKINRYVNNEYEENCYLIYKDNFALIIDPGSKISEMEVFIKENKLIVVGILITHYHMDHTGALEYYKKLYDTIIIDYESKKNVKIQNFEFEIIDFFGHTMDSVSFYFKNDNVMFTGDFLFKGTIGNYDLSNEKIMYNSLLKILKYDKSIKIYPGHEEDSTLEYEFLYNPYLKGLKNVS